MRMIYMAIAVLILLLSIDRPAQCAGPATTISYQGGVISMDQPTFEIRKVYGVRLTPKDPVIKSTKKEVYFPHTIENLSNTSNRIDIEVAPQGQQDGLEAELIMDDNDDGIHQLSEATRLGASIELSEGAALHFFLRIKCPPQAKTGDAFSAIIKASCRAKDGAGYVGDNGIIYGGEDETRSSDTLVLE